MRLSSFPKAAWVVLLLVGLVAGCLSTDSLINRNADAASTTAPRDSNGRFTNFDPNLSKGSLGVRLSFFARRVLAEFRDRTGLPEMVPNDGKFLRENAEHSQPTVTWIGHATLLVQMQHLTFLTDPIWSKRASPISFLGPGRLMQPGVAIEDLPEIDFVLISHNHYDHLDLPTLRRLATRSANTQFLVPLGNGQLLRDNGIANVQELDWGQSVKLDGATIHCLPSQHWSKRGLNDTNKALWSAWAVTGEDRRFYFAGDTGYFPGFVQTGQALGPFDLAAVPIGAYEPSAMMRASHLNPEEAVRVAGDLKARKALAIHYGTFDLSDEPTGEPPRRFKDAAQQAGQTAWVMSIGETREF